MKDFVRTLFRIRKPRRPLPAGPFPQVGGTIILGNIKMDVTVPIEQDLWDWMLLTGWRVLTISHDRRSSIQLPSGALGLLVAADPDDRERLQDRMLDAARKAWELKQKVRP